jgi:hypothetical protein
MEEGDNVIVNWRETKQTSDGLMALVITNAG